MDKRLLNMSRLALCLHLLILQAAGQNLPSNEDLLTSEMLVPVNWTKSARGTVDESEEGSGYGGLHRIKPMPPDLGVFMERMQAAPVEGEKQSNPEETEIELIQDDGSGDTDRGEEEIPKAEAITDPIDDPFTREEGMEEVYKDLNGVSREISDLQTNDNNRQENALSVLASEEGTAITNLEDVQVHETLETNTEEGSGQSVTLFRPSDTIGNVAIEEKERFEDKKTKDTTGVMEELENTTKRLENGDEGEVLEISDISMQNKSKAFDEQEKNDDRESTKADYTATADIKAEDSISILNSSFIQDDLKTAVVPIAQGTAVNKINDIAEELEEQHTTEAVSDIENSAHTFKPNTSLTREKEEEVTQVYEIITQHSTSTMEDVTELNKDHTTPLPIPSIVVSVGDVHERNTDNPLQLLLVTTKAGDTETTFTSSEASTAEKATKVTKLNEEKITNSTLGQVETMQQTTQVEDVNGTIILSMTNQHVRVESSINHEDEPNVKEASGPRTLSMYIIVGVLVVFFIVLIGAVVFKKRHHRQKIQSENSQDRDTEKALLGNGKYKDDIDEHNIKNNEITPLVIKQNSQINKFEKNANFSSPKNLNTIANEKNIEKDNMLKSNHTVIDGEVEDTKKSTESELNEGKKRATEELASLGTEKVIVRTHFDLDSIPRKPVLVSRNGQMPGKESNT